MEVLIKLLARDGRKTRPLFLVLFLSIAVLSGCGKELSQNNGPESPASNDQISITRWASVVPAATEIFFALGIGDSVVGVSRFCDNPPEVKSLPHVGDLASFDLEKMVIMKVEGIVHHPSQIGPAQNARKLGITTVEIPSGGIDDLFKAVEKIAVAAGVPARGVELSQSLQDELAPVAPRKNPPRVLIVTSREPGSFHGIYAPGPGSFYHDLIERAGGRNVLEDAPIQSVRLEAIDVVNKNPDIIVELAGEGLHTRDADQIRREWKELGFSAVHAIAGDTALIPGPRIGHFYRELIDILDRYDS